MKFNPNDYEPVKKRKLRFFADHPDGRIIPDLVNPDSVSDHAIFKVAVYKDSCDQALDKPLATGYAHEIRDKEKKLNKYGKEYESVNYTSWVENCEESAVGRALDNAGYASNSKCSREEMEKAARMKEVVESKNQIQQLRNSVINGATEILMSCDEKSKDDVKKDLLDKLAVENSAEILKENDIQVLQGMLKVIENYT